MNKKNPNPNNKNTHKNPPPQQTTQTHHTTIIVPLLKMWIPGYFIMMDWLKPALEHPHSCLFPSPALPALWDGGENEKSIRERAHRLTWGYFNKWKKEEKEQVVQRRLLHRLMPSQSLSHRCIWGQPSSLLPFSAPAFIAKQDVMW